MVLFVNACVRGEDSRTLNIAQYLMRKIRDDEDSDIEVVDLMIEDIKPLYYETVIKRGELVEKGKTDAELLKYARQFAKADTVVIAAPYWDLSFPAFLKLYIESICVSGITFVYTEEGIPKGLCNAKKIYYVTTAGGKIPEKNFGFDYIKNVAEMFFNIKEIKCFKAEELDVIGVDVDAKLAETKKEIDKFNLN